MGNRSIRFNLSKDDFKSYNIQGDVDPPFIDSYEIIEAYSNIGIISDQLIKKISKKMNQIHSINLSEEYWRSYIGFWVYDYIAYIYYCYHHLKKLKNNYADLKVLKSNLFYPEKPPIDYLHFNTLSGFGGDYGATYKGSLVTRKKPSNVKPKKMKRGGLASKK